MRERIQIDAGSPLITFQRGHPQGSTPEHLKSQLLDSGSPPRVVARQPRASKAVPALQQVQGMMSTAPPPVVFASHASTIPGLSLDFARASTLQYMSPNFGPKPGTGSYKLSGQEMQVTASEQMQASTGSSQAMEMERSRSRDLERKQQVQSEQQQETQRYEPSGHVTAVAPAAPAGNVELTPEFQEGASVPASWLQCIFVNPHSSLVAHMTQALAFFFVNPHSSLVDHMTQALAFFLWTVTAVWRTTWLCSRLLAKSYLRSAWWDAPGLQAFASSLLFDLALGARCRWQESKCN